MTPQLLHDVEFREAKRGGYNTQDVDDFLERLAVGLERQEAQQRETRHRLETAEERIADAERRATIAEQRAAEGGDADDTLRRTLVLAQRTADAAIREAEEEAARTLAGAKEEADRLLSEANEVSARARAEAEDDARRAHEDARARVLAEMRDLESARDQLRRDVDALDEHLEAQRARVQQSADALHQLLDDPSALAPVEPPAVSDVTAPAEARPPLVAAPTEAAPDDVEPVDDATIDLDDRPAAWLPDDDAWEDADDDVPPPSLFSRPSREEEGPATQPVEQVAEDDGPDDDAYLAELRKAMTDDAPLGPRDDPHTDLYEPANEPSRSRFGRRR